MKLADNNRRLEVRVNADTLLMQTHGRDFGATGIDFARQNICSFDADRVFMRENDSF